jgi:transcriptional regulator GlxA family with amidase domain
MQIAIGLYDRFTALDAMGPYQVLCELPDVDLRICAERRGRLVDEKGLLRFDVEHTFDDVPTPDVLVVPGGTITRKIAAERGPIVDWIASAHEHTTWTASVCTGALLLGAAGLLDGLQATTHWCAYDNLRSYGAEPTEQRVVFQGKIVTGAGVSAGIDMALALVGAMYGPEVAQAIQLGIEYDPQPPYDAGSPSKAPAPVYDMVAGLMAQAQADVLAG